MNKYAVVTGSSTRIGRATDIALTSHGFTTYLIARRKDKLEGNTIDQVEN